MSPAGGRSSAVVNAVAVMVLALVPLADWNHGTGVDHRLQRPWGCQTCHIPAPPSTTAEDTDSRAGNGL